MKIGSLRCLLFNLLCALSLTSGFNDLNTSYHNDPDSIIYNQLSKKLYRVTDTELKIAKELTNFPQFKRLISSRFNKVVKPGEDLTMVQNELTRMDPLTGKDITKYCDFLYESISYKNLENYNSIHELNDQLRPCKNSVLYYPFKMAEMLEFTTETSNLEISQNADKRTMSISLYIRTGINNPTTNLIELTSIIVLAEIEVKFLYQCELQEKRCSYYPME